MRDLVSTAAAPSHASLALRIFGWTLALVVAAALLYGLYRIGFFPDVTVMF